jgi:hypothetical protein
MKIYPLPQAKLPNIQKLLEKADSELVSQKGTTVEHVMASVERGYGNRTVGVYVDDVDNPLHCLVLALVPGFYVEGLMVVVLLIYSMPEERGNKEALDALHLTIENYAKIHGAETILGSSWIYRGSRGIDAMWKARGYEAQEIAYVKLL